MTTVAHGILHLSVPIVPETPPPGVPARSASHVLLSALNELFDSLGHLNRAITSTRSLVMTALMGSPGPNTLTYAEVMVLRRCRHDLENWRPKWLFEIQSGSLAQPRSPLTTDADHAKLPTGSGREFLLDLVTLYYRVALVVVDGYLNQAPQPDSAQYATTCRELLNLVVGKWSTSLHMWPKLFLHSALIAALSLPVEGKLAPDVPLLPLISLFLFVFAPVHSLTPDPVVRRAHDLFVALAHMLQTSGGKLLHRLMERIQEAHGVPAPSDMPQTIFTPVADLDLPTVMAYTGSDSFWADLSGVLGLQQGDVLSTPMQVENQVWPRELDWGVRQ